MQKYRQKKIFIKCFLPALNYNYSKDIYLITMTDQKPLFKAPYDIKDVSALFTIVTFTLIILAIVGNNLFGLFQQKFNFG